MSTSDELRRILRRYLLLSAFCGLFSAIYEHFSHGVCSPFMVGLFLVPLLAGAVPALLLLSRRAKIPARCRSLWGPGVATLTVGSCLRGVFDIYGTTAPLVGVYWLAGGALLLAAALSGLRGVRNAGDGRAGDF